MQRCPLWGSWWVNRLYYDVVYCAQGLATGDWCQNFYTHGMTCLCNFPWFGDQGQHSRQFSDVCVAGVNPMFCNRTKMQCNYDTYIVQITTVTNPCSQCINLKFNQEMAKAHMGPGRRN
jgi:hypothetical protein